MDEFNAISILYFLRACPGIINIRFDAKLCELGIKYLSPWCCEYRGQFSLKVIPRINASALAMVGAFANHQLDHLVSNKSPHVIINPAT